MGKIVIRVEGSFNKRGTHQFSAMHGGHAQAVAEAIAYLSQILLPAAIRQDHKLQEQGHYPDRGFGLPQVEANNDE